MIRIITDSAADFEHSESEKLGISTIPLAVYIDGREYKDDFLHSKERFYRLAKLSKDLPKTSQPSPYVYECALKKARDNGDSVVIITVSSALSGSYQSAVLARDLLGYKDCYVIDSKSASAGQKLVVKEALRLRDNGFSAKEIADFLLKFIKRIMIFACIDDMKYLYGGGRHTNAAVLLGSTGRIKPVISVTESGSVAFEAKTIGMRHGMNHMLLFLKKYGIDSSYPLYIMHTNSRNLALYFSKLIISKGISFDEGGIVSVGSAVGSHIGEGSIGIAFVKKE
nr:DegV family protein [uncultured Ruminococcus sp.]